MKTWLLWLALAAPAWGEDAASAPSDFTDADALYAPEEMTGTAQAQEQGAARKSYYSTAVIKAYRHGRPGELLSGAELFIDGHFVGKSPLSLSGFLVNKDALSLTARLPGYVEASRPAFLLPAEGEARVALLPENAASWYTTPSWIVGLAAIGGSIVSFSQKSEATTALGTALVGGGVGLILLTQALAHFLHQPALEKDVARVNASPKPVP